MRDERFGVFGAVAARPDERRTCPGLEGNVKLCGDACIPGGDEEFIRGDGCVVERLEEYTTAMVSTPRVEDILRRTHWLLGFQSCSQA